MSNPIKQIRGQIRQIVIDLLPEILSTELGKTLQKQVHSKMMEIEKQSKDTLHEINNRHKDTMSYLVRSVTVPAKKE